MIFICQVWGPFFPLWWGFVGHSECWTLICLKAQQQQEMCVDVMHRNKCVSLWQSCYALVCVQKICFVHWVVKRACECEWPRCVLSFIDALGSFFIPPGRGVEMCPGPTDPWPRAYRTTPPQSGHYRSKTRNSLSSAPSRRRAVMRFSLRDEMWICGTVPKWRLLFERWR